MVKPSRVMQGRSQAREHVSESIFYFPSVESHSQAGSAKLRPIYHPLMQNHSCRGPAVLIPIPDLSFEVRKKEKCAQSFRDDQADVWKGS